MRLEKVFDPILRCVSTDSQRLAKKKFIRLNITMNLGNTLGNTVKVKLLKLLKCKMAFLNNAE